MKRRNVLKSLLAVPATFILPSVFKEKSTVKKTGIPLLNTSVAGFQYYNGEGIWHYLKAGHELRLVREPKNQFDYDAVEVYLGRDKIGYIPRPHNTPIAQMMDRGLAVRSKIQRLSKSDIPGERVGIAVEMVV